MSAFRSRAAAAGAVAAGYVLIALAATWPSTRTLTSRFLGSGSADTYLISTVLAWGYQTIFQGRGDFWDGPFYFPAERIIAYSDHLLGLQVFYAPARLFTDDPVVAYNATYIAAMAFTGIGAFLLARHVTGDVAASFLAGGLVEMLPFRIYHADHLALISMGWIPLALLGFHRFLETGMLRYAAGGATAYALAFLTGFYQGMFTSVVLPPFLVLAARGRGVRRLVAAGIALAAAVGILLAIHLPMLMMQRERKLARSLEEQFNTSARPTDYLRAPYGTLAARIPFPFPDPNGASVFGGERIGYPGLAMLVLSIAGIAARGRERRPLVVSYAALAALAALLGLGPRLLLSNEDVPSLDVPLPYDLLLRYVPGFSALRAPARFASIMALLLVPVAAAGAAWLIGRRPGVRWAAVLAILLVHRIEAWPLRFFPPPEVPDIASDPVYRDLMETKEPMALFEIPSDPLSGSRAAFATLFHGHPVVNGHTGFLLPTHATLFERSRAFPDPEILSILWGMARDDVRVRRVIVRRSGFASGRYDTIAATARNHPALRIILQTQDELLLELYPRETVFRVVPGAAPSGGAWRFGPLPLARFAGLTRREHHTQSGRSFARSATYQWRVPLRPGPTRLRVTVGSEGEPRNTPVELALFLEDTELCRGELAWGTRAAFESPTVELGRHGRYHVEVRVTPIDAAHVRRFPGVVTLEEIAVGVPE